MSSWQSSRRGRHRLPRDQRRSVARLLAPHRRAFLFGSSAVSLNSIANSLHRRSSREPHDRGKIIFVESDVHRIVYSDYAHFDDDVRIGCAALSTMPFSIPSAKMPGDFVISTFILVVP
jgi:hypothetical protein